MALAMASIGWRVKIFWWCAVLLGLAGLVVTFSRGGLLGLCVAAAALVCLGVYRRLVPVSYLVSILAAALLSAPLVYKYMSTRPEYVSARFDLWKVGLPILWDYPVLGAGVNNAVVVSLNYPDPEGAFWKTSFHQFYLTTGIEIGLVGLGLFLATLAMAGWLAFSSFRPPKNQTEDQLTSWLSITVPAVLLGLCTHLMVDHLTGEINATITWMVIATGPILLRLRRAETGLERI
jgi:O-antigen ligase